MVRGLGAAVVGLVMLAGLGLRPALADEGLITWYKPEFPPLSIVNGPYAGLGYSDKIEAYLIKALDGYRHRVQVSPFKRTVRDMKKGLNACSVTLLRTPERETFIAFTRPARLLLPPSLIVRKADREVFRRFETEGGKVAATAVIEGGELRLGYSNGRSYTAPLDALIAANKERSNVVERLGSEGPKGLLDMLMKGHIDALFGQHVEARFHGLTLGFEDDLAILPVAEIKDHTVGYIGCSDTPWGRKVVAEIDELLETAVREPEFRSFFEEFLDDEGRAHYRAVYDRFFGLN